MNENYVVKEIPLILVVKPFSSSRSNKQEIGFPLSNFLTFSMNYSFLLENVKFYGNGKKSSVLYADQVL